MQPDNGSENRRKPNNMEDKYQTKRVYTIAELGKILNVHPQTLRLWIKKGQLKAHKMSTNGKFIITEADLEDAGWLEVVTSIIRGVKKL
jgi:excisionase family DNA binding protein